MRRVFLYLKMRMKLVKVQECYKDIIIHKHVSRILFNKWLHDTLPLLTIETILKACDTYQKRVTIKLL